MAWSQLSQTGYSRRFADVTSRHPATRVGESQHCLLSPVYGQRQSAGLPLDDQRTDSRCEYT